MGGYSADWPLKLPDDPQPLPRDSLVKDTRPALLVGILGLWG